jgi:CheY-like chemotaxis protein
MNNKCILLVEDNQDDLDLTLRALRKHSLANEIVVARDGPQALDALFGRGQYSDNVIVPAVILLDLKLPKIDGLEVLQTIRNDGRTRLYPVVILTSSSEEEDKLKGYSLGANSYIRKPVDFVQFADTMLQLQRYWLELNDVAPRKKDV